MDIAGIKSTNIRYIDEIGMFSFDWGLYGANFDSIYYNFNSFEKVYGDFFEGTKSEDGFHLEGYIIGKTKVFGFYLVTFYNLKDFSIKTYFLTDFNAFTFLIKGKTFNIIILKDYKGKILYISDFNEKDFKIGREDGVFYIENELFGSRTHTFEPKFNKAKDERKDIDPSIKKASVIDFFFFDDILSKLNHANFKQFLDYLSGKNIGNDGIEAHLSYSVSSFSEYGIGKISYSVNVGSLNKFELGDFGKLMLSYFPKYLAFLSINNKNLKYLDNHMENLSDVSIFDGIKKDFVLEEGIFDYSKDNIDFIKSINMLLYVLFVLNDNLSKINDISNMDSRGNPYLDLLKKRNEINKDSLEITAKNYSENLKQMLAIMIKKKS